MRVFISWAHSGENWTEDRARLWENHVERFAELLQRAEIGEVFLDLWVANERDVNWNHWGPNQIEDADYVLVAMNEPWAQRWSGKNNPKFGAGAAAEANALHGLFNDDQSKFQRKVRLVRLPRWPEDQIPLDLSGVKVLTVSELSSEGIDGVVRDLKNESRPRLRIPDASVGREPQPTATSGFRDGDMLLLRFRDLHPGITTLDEHMKVIASDSEHETWWGWWKKPLEDPRLSLWSAFQSHLSQARGLVGLFNSGAQAGNVTRALAVNVLPPRLNEFEDTPPFAPPPEEWHRIPAYYRPTSSTSTNSCAWISLRSIDTAPCRFYSDYQFVSDDPQYAGVIIDHPSKLLNLSDRSVWHVRKVTR